MDLFLLRLHQKQILHQCYAALNAVQQANSALNVHNQEIFWASVQNFLTATANISKTCWGGRGRFAAQRAQIRESLNITDDSPLADRRLRNHLEHYDERLDEWYHHSSNHNYADFIIGPRATTIVGLDNTDIFRFFDPETNEVIFWGQRYALQPLVNEITKLLPIAQVESSKPH